MGKKKKGKKQIETCKVYYYTNDIGVEKKLCVSTTPNANNTYNFTLWAVENGEFCGCGEFTQDRLNAYLEHYHITP